MVGGEGEDRCGSNSGLQSFEGMLVCRAPDPGLGLSGWCMEWSGNVGEAFDELSVEVDKP